MRERRKTEGFKRKEYYKIIIIINNNNNKRGKNKIKTTIKKNSESI